MFCCNIYQQQASVLGQLVAKVIWLGLRAGSCWALFCIHQLKRARKIIGTILYSIAIVST